MSLLTGQFILQDNVLLLNSDDGRNFPIQRVHLRSEQSSNERAIVDLPQPFVLDSDGKIIKEGAKVLIGFIEGVENPIYMGCLNSFSTQRFLDAGLRINNNLLDTFREFRKTEDFSVQVTYGKDGYVIAVGDICFTIKSDKGISFYSPETVNITGEKSAALLGEDIEIGGNNNKNDNPAKSKAEKISLNAKEVYAGMSPERIPDLKLDQFNQESLDNPKFQPGLNGFATLWLVKLIVEIIQDATYMGNGVVVQMSVEDKLELETQVLNKLQKAIPETFFLASKKEVTE